MELMHAGAIFVRHLRLWLRDKYLFLSMIYWPLFDILIWGFMGTWMQKTGSGQGLVILLNIVLWQMVCRTSTSVFWTFIEEIITNHLSPLFSYPLRLQEWVVGTMSFALLQIGVMVLFAAAMIKYFFSVSLLLVFHAVLLFGPALLMSGFAVGFLILQLICIVGKRGQEIAWIINWIPALLSGVFYPIEVLPPIAQKIGYLLPMTYLFDGVRAWVAGQAYGHLLVTGYGLSAFYLVITVVCFMLVFESRKKQGLVRLSD